MKVNDLLDEIFFKKGNRDLLPIASKFAGDERTEIFGISENFMDDTIRLFIIVPEVLEKDKFNCYIGDNTGEYAQVGNSTYERDHLLGFYGQILSDRTLLKTASDSNLTKAAISLRSPLIDYSATRKSVEDYYNIEKQ